MKKSKVLASSFSIAMLAVLATFIVTGLAMAACPDGITAYWKLDETAGPDYADFISSADGVSNTSDPVPVESGQINGAQRFDGTNGIDVEANSAFNWRGTESFTIEFWVNTEGNTPPSVNQVIVGRVESGGLQWWVGLTANDGYPAYVLLDSAGNIINNSAGVVAESLYDGGWHHVVLVRDAVNNEQTLYVDGAPKGAVAAGPNNFAGGFASATASLNIGYLNTGGQQYRFTGLIDEVALYNIALTPEEVLAHTGSSSDYCDGSPAPSKAPYPENIISIWKLDEAGGTAYVDSVGQNDGEGNDSPDAEAGGMVNGAQRFDGSADGIDVAASSTFDWLGFESFSVEFWVNTEGNAPPTVNQVIVGRVESGGLQWWVGLTANNGYPAYVLLDSAGNIINNSTGVVAESLYDGGWHHVLLVRDAVNNQQTLYVDGAPKGAVAAGPNNFAGGFASASSLNIGYLNTGGQQYRFAGLIDEVAIYDAALTADDAIAHNNAGASGVESLRPAPTASATTDTPQVAEGESINLDSSGSTAGYGEAPITSYQWTQTDSTGITASFDGAVAQPTFTAPDVSETTTLTFSLTVTASDGQTSSPATVDVQVSDSGSTTPTAPTADAGSDQSVTVGSTVSLDGRGSSAAAGGTLTYAWSQTDTSGYTVTLDDATSETPSFTAPEVTAQTVLTFQLTVTEDGVTSSTPATVNVTVNPVGPTAAAGDDQTVDENATVVLDGSGSSAYEAGGTITYAWTQTDSSGYTVTLDDATIATPTFTAPDVAAGGATLTFQLTVTEGDVTATDSVDIIVNNVATDDGGDGGGGGCFIGSMF